MKPQEYIPIPKIENLMILYLGLMLELDESMKKVKAMNLQQRDNKREYLQSIFTMETL